MCVVVSSNVEDPFPPPPPHFCLSAQKNKNNPGSGWGGGGGGGIFTHMMMHFMTQIIILGSEPIPVLVEIQWNLVIQGPWDHEN